MADKGGGGGGGAGVASSTGTADYGTYQGTGQTHAPTGRTGQQFDARDIIRSYLEKIGLNGISAHWLWGEITKSGLTDATAIASKIELDIQKTDAFKDRFPGIALRQKAGLPPMSVSQYLAYEDQAKQLATQAGLPTQFMNRNLVGQLIGHDVSASELSTRVTQGYIAAMQAPQETRNLLHQYYGVNLGHLAAYYLAPDHALPIIQQQLAAAQIGSAGELAHAGTIHADTATLLAQAGISQAQAQSAFAQLAPLTGQLESAMPGQSGQQTVTLDQMVRGQLLGDADAQLATQRAQEAHTASSRGGGGFAQSQTGGVAGAGYGTS